MTSPESLARKIVVENGPYLDSPYGCKPRELESDIATALQEVRDGDIEILTQLREELKHVGHHEISEELWRIDMTISKLKEQK